MDALTEGKGSYKEGEILESYLQKFTDDKRKAKTEAVEVKMQNEGIDTEGTDSLWRCV